MKDPEFAAIKASDAHCQRLGHRDNFIRRNFAPKQVLLCLGLAVFIVGAIFGIGTLASLCEGSYEERHGLGPTGEATSGLAKTGDKLVPRAVYDEGPLAIGSPVIVVAHGPASDAMATGTEDGVRVPISTQTELSTLYSFSRIVVTTTYTSTATHETSVVIPGEETGCSPSVITETKTALITVTVSPLPSSASGGGYVTVTGAPSTVTDVNTDFNTLTGPTVITVSGEPSTVTDVQTDISYTSGLPDVTVSGSPSTVTDYWTDISVTQGPPDVTVSGAPSTVTDIDVSYSITTSTISSSGTSVITVIISDLWDPEPTTITTVATTKVTVTTVHPSPVETVTHLYPPPAQGDSSTIDYTSEAKGGGYSRTSQIITATVVIDPPFPSNGTSTYPSGTVTNLPVSTTPAVVSGGSKKPEPRGWGGNGTSHLTCTVMLIAVIMFML